MLGLIVTGHGHFATGIKSSVNLIAGEPKNMCFVDFDKEVEELRADLLAAIDSLTDVDGILVLSDLTGGSPFKTAVEVSVMDRADRNIKVIGGSNLPMAIELSLTKDFADDIETFLANALNVGKDNIVLYEMPAPKQETVEDEDGI